MTVRDIATIDRYVAQYADIIGMLANLQEFVDTIPAPEDDGNSIECIDYGYIGSLNEIHTALTVACEYADAMSE